MTRSTFEAVSWLGLGKLGNNRTTIAWDNLSPAKKTIIDQLIRENFYNGPSNCN